MVCYSDITNKCKNQSINIMNKKGEAFIRCTVKLTSYTTGHTIVRGWRFEHAKHSTMSITPRTFLKNTFHSLQNY